MNTPNMTDVGHWTNNYRTAWSGHEVCRWVTCDVDEGVTAYVYDTSKSCDA